MVRAHSWDLILTLPELEVCVIKPAYPTLESAQVAATQHRKWHVTCHRAGLRRLRPLELVLLANKGNMVN